MKKAEKVIVCELLLVSAEDFLMCFSALICIKMNSFLRFYVRAVLCQ